MSETKEKFDLPSVMTGTNNKGNTVITFFNNNMPLNSIEMNDEYVLRLIKALCANINASCNINRI